MHFSSNMIKFTIIFCLIYQTYLQNCPEGYADSGDVCDECGISDVSPNVRIIGGRIAESGSWPSHVFIVQHYQTDYTYPDGKMQKISQSFVCGGTLINRNTIVTTASCITTSFMITYNATNYLIRVTLNQYNPTYESMFTIYLGLNDISSILSNPEMSIPPNLPSTCVVSNVSKIIEHYQFNSQNYLNDIALFLLPTPVSLNSNIKPACIPDISSSYPSYSTPCYAVGWGSIVSGGSMSEYLRNIQLTIYNSILCNNVSTGLSKMWNSQICAGEYIGGKDTCGGDGGGGLYVMSYYGGKSRYMLAGLTSYGQGCALPFLPGIYTRVSYYKNWITANWKLTLVSSSSTISLSKTTTKSVSTSEPNKLDLGLIGLSVGIPLGLLTIAAIVIAVVFIRKRNKSVSKKKQNSMKIINESKSQYVTNITSHNYLNPVTLSNLASARKNLNDHVYEDVYAVEKNQYIQPQ